MIRYLTKLAIRSILRIMYPFWRVRNDQIIFESYSGKQISCNPYYIWLELQKNYPNCKYIWVYNNPPVDGICCVRRNSLKYIHYIMTSKVCVWNVTFPSYIPIRKSQIIIQTWHGHPYKRIGFGWDRYKRKRRDFVSLSKIISIYLSTGKEYTEILSNSFLASKDKILPTGYPRNDMFFNEEKVKDANKKIRTQYSIADDEYIILYAPTFRSLNNPIFNSNIDIKSLKDAILHRWGKRCRFLFRGHHHLSIVNFEKENVSSLDVSGYPYMQELLCAADMLISDYSSCIWDYSFLYRPCILFPQDLSDYQSIRNFYLPIEAWGFPIAKTSEELVENILNFDEQKFVQRMKLHHAELGSYETGNATQTICRIIVSNMGL